ARGMGLLCFDYRGVGTSDGKGSPRNLRADARAAWSEALQRVDGDARRIVLRGNSLGGLAVSYLLDDGVEPGAVVVTAPVRAETVVGRFADRWADGIEKPLAKLLVRRPASTDVVGAIRASAAPTLVILGSQDDYLSDDERALFAEAADEFVAFEEDHVDTGLASRGLRSVEWTFYARRFGLEARLHARVAAVRAAVPDAPSEDRIRRVLERVTIDTATTVAAVAATWDETDLWALPKLGGWLRSIPPMPFESARLLVDPEPGKEVFGLGTYRDWLRRHPHLDTPEKIRDEVRHYEPLVAVRVDGVLIYADRELIPVGVPSKPPSDRRKVRMALRAAAIPVRDRGDHLEYWRDGAWHLLRLDAVQPVVGD
ncbi:MAG: hypothetical protein AAGD14_16730, partial [Planctomycetota bacterium]